MSKIYVMPKHLVTYLEDRDIALNTLKLAHNFIQSAHEAVNRTTEFLWRELSVDRLVYSSDVREACGWDSQRSNRPIQLAISDGSARRVFRHIHFEANNRAINYRFQNRLVEAAKAHNFDPEKRKDQYALLDFDQIAGCGSTSAIKFYVRGSMHRRQHYPKFLLPGVGLAASRRAQAGSCAAGPATTAPWSMERAKWMRAAEEFTNLTGDTILFRHVQGLRGPSDFSVEVLIVNETTKWRPSNLFKTRAGLRYTEISNGSSRSLSQAEVKARAKGDWPFCPQKP